MFRTLILAISPVLLLAFAVVGYSFTASAVSDARTDCPGKITCPLTGDIICADECPLGSTTAESAELPPCCRSK